MKCQKCGFDLPDGCKFCPSCGESIKGKSNAVEMSNEKVFEKYERFSESKGKKKIIPSSYAKSINLILICTLILSIFLSLSYINGFWLLVRTIIILGSIAIIYLEWPDIEKKSVIIYSLMILIWSPLTINGIDSEDFCLLDIVFMILLIIRHFKKYRKKKYIN